MNLTKVCNITAAKVLGKPGTVVEYMYEGNPYSAFRVIKSVGNGYLKVDTYGSFPSTLFRKK